MPTELQQSGFLGNITYKGQEVKIKGVPFSEILPKRQDGETDKEQFSIDRQVADANRIADDLRQMLNRGASTEELRRYVDGISGGRQQTTVSRNVTPAERIVRAAHRQGLNVQEYLRQNRELYDVDGVKQRFSIKLRGSHWLPRNFAYDIVCTLMWG